MAYPPPSASLANMTTAANAELHNEVADTNMDLSPEPPGDLLKENSPKQEIAPYERPLGLFNVQGIPSYTQTFNLGRMTQRYWKRDPILLRPLVVIGVESTGLRTRIESERIVGITCVRLDPDGRRDQIDYVIRPLLETNRIEGGIFGTQGLSTKSRFFAHIGIELFNYLEGCDFSGFGLESFDLPVLAREFNSCGIKFPSGDVSLLDSDSIFTHYELSRRPKDVFGVYQFYYNKELRDGHKAATRANAAADILLAQLRKYDDLPRDIQALHDYTHSEAFLSSGNTRKEAPIFGLDPYVFDPYELDADEKLVWRNGEVVFNYGMHKYKSLRSVAEDSPSYLRWMLSEDFPPKLKSIVGKALQGNYP